MPVNDAARGRGRPAGVSFPIAVRTYENEEGARLLAELAELRGVSQAALLRTLVREEARRQGLTRDRDRMRAAAERLREYYATDPEVREWLEADDGYVEPTAEGLGRSTGVE